MRPLKFRAWDKRTRKMLPVSDISWEDQQKSDSPNLYEVTCFTHFMPKRVKLVEIMQFTGRKDKNGQEIYEGDTLQCQLRSDTKPIRYAVKFKNGAFVMSTSGNYLGNLNLRKDEVIGNIYENPELLEDTYDK